jgi:hypothetical protein
MNWVALSASVGAGDESGRGDRKGKCNIYGTQWLESQPHLKGVVAS